MRNLFELLFYIRELLYLLLAIIISLMLLLTGESRQALTLQAGYIEIVGSIPRPGLDLSDFISYKQENQVLRQQLLRYSLLNAELADVARENEHLREILQFTENTPYDLQVAEVISRGASSVVSTVTLNVGRDQGIMSNQPVLSTDGLIGKTANVSARATVVHLINDRNFRLSVKLGEAGLRGILRPLHGSLGEVSGITTDGMIKPGDKVLTSGFSDIYPKNLPVAVVEEVYSIPGETYSRVRVHMLADPKVVEHVFVMKWHGPDS
ncbi:MAG: rod shape-determining protein MreC [Candidatus Marinimicrobia bacterium]|nr:rod shape-determining protein MreC [Candidatus Neomarinimicrobiota bacterium]